MNRTQWFVLGGGLFLLGIFLMSVGGWGSCGAIMSDASFIACMIRKYAYAIPALISWALGFIFLVLGSLEKKKK